jgi:hypothetical protein
MSTTASIARRPVPTIAAAAALAAGIAIGALTLTGQDTTQSPSPSSPAQLTRTAQTTQHHHWQPTTAGGRVMTGS